MPHKKTKTNLTLVNIIILKYNTLFTCSAGTCSGALELIFKTLLSLQTTHFMADSHPVRKPLQWTLNETFHLKYLYCLELNLQQSPIPNYTIIPVFSDLVLWDK